MLCTYYISSVCFFQVNSKGEQVPCKGKIYKFLIRRSISLRGYIFRGNMCVQPLGLRWAD